MKAIAIISEYNPFHLGHAYQLNTLKKNYPDYALVVLMSGSFVQRGEPAIINKWCRAEMALSAGADIVLELPLFYSLASAEPFAYGAVGLLSALSSITFLCFGSETGHLAPLQAAADLYLTEPTNYRKLLKKALCQGASFPAARAIATSAYLGDDYKQLLKQSNNILAIEYLKALRYFQSPIKPLTIKRLGQAYNQTLSLSELNSHKTTDYYVSATTIRHYLQYQTSQTVPPYDLSLLTKLVPDDTAKLITQQITRKLAPVTINDLRYPLYQQLLTRPLTDLTALWDTDPQLLQRLKNNLVTTRSVEDYISEVATRNYPKTKISRTLMHLYFNIQQTDYDQLAKNSQHYVRLLGFTKKATPLLREWQKGANLAVLTRPASQGQHLPLTARQMLAYDQLADHLYQQIIYQKWQSRLESPRYPIIIPNPDGSDLTSPIA